MARKALVWLLVLGLPLASPGSMGWLAFADRVGATYQTPGDPGLPPAAQLLMRQLNNPALAKKLSQQQIDQAKKLVLQYPDAAADPKTAASLKQIAADLNDPSKDPSSELQAIFDKYQNGARDEDAADSYVSVLGQGDGTQTVAVRDASSGQLLFMQESQDIGYRLSQRTILRQDPTTGRQVVDAIVDVDDRDAASIQHVVYNRKMQEFLLTLKQFYFDQCPLVRKINNGGQNYGMGLTGTGCVGEQGGPADDKVTQKAVAAMLKVYRDQQNKFTSELVYTDGQGRPRSVMDYLQEMKDAQAKGTLARLDWRDLEAVQRSAMRFYSENELITLQKYVLIQLTSFFSQITNSQPKGDKEGVQDASLKDNAALEKELDEIEKGHLQDYDMVMQAAIRAAHLSPEDQKFVPKSLYDATGEAMAYLGYAVKTNVAHAFDAGTSGQEQDAVIEEAQHWIKLAQIQLQTFEASSLAIQMERLKEGQLSEHLGLTDDASKAEAEKLAEEARSTYLPRLGQETLETKAFLLKDAVSNLFQTAQNVGHANLTKDDLAQHLRAMSAKLEEIRYLYLAKQFERFKNRADLQVQASVLDKMQTAPAYTLFIQKVAAAENSGDHDLEPVAEMSDTLQRLSDELKGLAARPDLDKSRMDFERLKDVLMSVDPSFATGLPTPQQLDLESKRMTVKWARFNQAYQTFSTDIRMFDMLNELDLYTRQYMSSKNVSSASQGVGGYLKSMKWMDAAMNFFNAGHRDDLLYAEMKRISPDAYQKLVGNKSVRDQALKLMNQGDFNAAMKLMAALDQKSAERAAKEAEADKAEKDPFEGFDFESAIVAQPDDDLAASAQGAMMGCYQSLQRGILTYLAAAGVTDMVTTSILTAGLAPLAKVAFSMADGVTAMAEGLNALKFAREGEELALIQRVWNLTVDMSRGLLTFGGRTITAWGNNLKNTTAIKDVGAAREGGTALQRIGLSVMGLKNDYLTLNGVKQLALGTFPQALARSVKMTATLTGASVVMSVGQHLYEGQNSQFRNAGDAALQGAVGGLNFGGKAGLLFMFSPIQATAMGGNGFGRMMTGLAETPGPISGLSSFVAKLAPEWSEGTIAKQGLLGKAAEWGLQKSPAWQLASRTAVFGGGMLDGMLKFTAIAVLPKWAAEGGSLLGSDALSKIEPAAGAKPASAGPSDGSAGAEPVDGMTAYMRKISQAQNLGQEVAQLGWMFLPMQSMQATSADMRQQMDQMHGFAQIHAEGGARADELITSPNNVGEVTYQRSRGYRLFSRENPFGETGGQGSLTTNAQFRKAEISARLGKASWGEIIFNSLYRGETGVQDAAARQEFLASGKTRAPVSGSALERNPAAEMVGRALDELPKDAAQGRLYAYYDEAGKLEKVAVRPEAGRAGFEFEVTREGQASLARDADGRYLSEANKKAAAKLGVGYETVEAGFQEAVADARRAAASGSAKTEAGATAAKAALKPGDWFVGISEAVEAGTEKLAEKLAENPDVRRQLLRAKGDPLELLSRDPQARKKVLQASGSIELHDAQSDLTFEIKGETFKKLRSALGRAGGDARRMLKDNPRLAAELQGSKDVSASLVLRIPETGEAVELGGKNIEDLRHMAEWGQLDRRSMGVSDFARSALVGDGGGRSLFKGRLWKIFTGRQLDTKSQIFTAEVEAAAKERLAAISKESPAERMSALQRRVSQLREQAPDIDAKLLEPLDAALAKGDLAGAKAELLKLSGGVEPSRLLSLKSELARDGPAGKKIAQALETVKGWGDAETARQLRQALAGEPTDEKVDAAAGVIDGAAKGQTLDTLDNISLRLDGKVAADDIIEAVHDELGRRIEQASGDDKLAMQGLRASLESDAFLRLANAKAVDAIQGYRPGDPAAQARLDEAKRLLVGTWERGVFGRKYALHVQAEKPDPADPTRKVKQWVWEVPPDHQFRDVNGHAIPSFRPHQREAIGQDLDELAKGNKMMYDLMKTSGGKTLLGFVLVSFLEKYAEARGRDGVYYVTTDAGLVAQTRDNYLAMFKGRKPSFEIIDYSELFLREAMAKQMGTLSPFASHDIYADELDQVGLGTPLSLGKFNGALTFAEIDPVQKVIRDYVKKAGLAPAGEKDAAGNPVVCAGLCGKYAALFDHQKMENPQEFEAFLAGDTPEAKAHPKEWEAFKKEWSDINSGFYKDLEKARSQAAGASFAEQIPESYVRKYAAKAGVKDLDAAGIKSYRAAIQAELLKEYDNAFGNWHHLGVFQAKYGSNPAWMTKVLKGAYMAGTYGDKLDATYKRDPDRDGIVSIVNDQALESLDTFQRTALEAREKVPVTLDFENAVVVNFRDLLNSARREGAALVAASGTQPAEEETFLQKLGVKTIGEGSPIDKVEKMPHKFIMDKGGQIPYIVARFKELMGKTGKINPDTGKPASNLAVVWLPDDASAEQLLGALEKAGVSRDKISIRMSPGSSFFLQDRYKLDYKDRMNDEGLRNGTVEIALMIGQGGFRGHEMPLQDESGVSQYNGGVIKMFVMDSASLTDVGSVQLAGRIDDGRVPDASRKLQQFELLDEFGDVVSNRYYKRDMPSLINDAIDGRQAAKLAELDGLLAARKLPDTPEMRDRIMKEPGFAEERKTYRDYLALDRLRDAIGPAKLAELSKLKRGDPKRSASVQSLLDDSKLASVLVIEMRRGNEKRALQSSGVSSEVEGGSRGPGPSLLDRLRGVLPGGGRRPAAPAPAS